MLFIQTTGCTEKIKMSPTTKKPGQPARKKGGAAPQKQAHAGRSAVNIMARYSGQILLGNQGPEPASPGRVIRDQDGYDALVAALPRTLIQMKQPSPRNDDALLARPKIDFERHMLVAAFRHSMYYGPKIDRVQLAPGEGLLVEVVHESPSGIMPMSSRDDVGTYEAVVVPRLDEDATFRVKKVVAGGGSGEPVGP